MTLPAKYKFTVQGEEVKPKAKPAAKKKAAKTEEPKGDK
jgi:hypothetical protein